MAEVDSGSDLDSGPGEFFGVGRDRVVGLSLGDAFGEFEALGGDEQCAGDDRECGGDDRADGGGCGFGRDVGRGVDGFGVVGDDVCRGGFCWRADFGGGFGFEDAW